MNKSIRRLTHPRALFNVVSRTVGTGARFVGVLMLMGAFALSPLAPLAGLSTQAVHAAGGDGSQGNPFIIETEQELENISDSDGKYYRLGNNLALSSDYTSISNFEGNFDGNDRTISGLNTSLFESVSGATIENLSLNGVVTSEEGWSKFGILVGSAEQSHIENVSVSGSITLTGNDPGTCGIGVGGLAGELWEASLINVNSSVVINAPECDKVGGLIGIFSNSEISDSSATGDVTGRDSVGGLIGSALCRLESDTPGLSRSFATGDAQGVLYVGGLVGEVNGTECHQFSIENSYARSSVRGDNYLGGLVGDNDGGFVSKSYATGNISFSGEPPQYIGGLVGGGHNNTVEFSFWDRDTTGQVTSVGGGEGMPTVEAGEDWGMTGSDYLYTGYIEDVDGVWDFTNIWAMDAGINDGYPHLRIAPSLNNTPVVVSFSPLDNATGVAVNTNLLITFDQNVVLSGSGDIIIFNSDDSIFEQISNSSGAISGSGTTWTINPTNDFAAGRGYYVLIATAAFNAVDGGGSFAGIDDETTWNFTTASGGGNNNEELSFTNPTDKTVAPYESLSITDLAIEGDGNEVLNVNLYTNFGTLEFGGVTGLTFVGSHMGPNLQFSGTRTAINAALETLTFSASSEGEATVEAIINGDDGEVMWFTNGHVYKVVTVPDGITWDDARTAAAGQTFGGVGGYLATIIDEEESDFVLTRIDESGWIGATDVAVEGEWNWVTGPEAVTKFWTGGMNGSAFDGKFNNWRREGANLEPNNAGGEVDGNPGEDCAQIRFGVGIPPGSWNDSPCNSTFNTYVVEFGGIDGELPDVVRTHFDITVSEAGDWADLTTVSATNIGKTSATIQGSGQLKNGLTVDDIDVGDGGILQVGFHFNTDSTVNWDENTHTAPVMNASAVGGNNTQVTFSGEVTGLECGTQYWYVAAYDYDAGGELGVASNVLSFTTASCGGGSGSSSGGGSRGGGTRTPAASLTQPPATPAAVANVITQNRALFIAARDAGITLPAFILNLLGLGDGVQTPTGGLCPRYAFTRDLQFGDEGEDVRALQRFLNCAGYQLGTSGPGAPGEETQYFVERTRASLIKFQEQYVTEVLAPINRTQGTGIFSTYTRAKVQSLMAQ